MYLPPDVALTVTIARAPSGRAGAFHSLAVMRSLVADWKRDPGIINTATGLVFLTPEKDELAEVDALFRFVRDAIRYTRDVHGVETIATPGAVLDRKVGDCDDKATLFAALAESIGYPTRFVMAAYHGSLDYEHVYVQVLTGDGWLDADTTEALPLGEAPAGATMIYTERI